MGSSDPGLVPRRRDLCRDGASRRRRLGTRPRRARHVVLERAVPVRDARVAGADRRAARLLPDRRPLDRARHPVPLGRAHDHARDRVRRRHPVRGRQRASGDPGARRAADVEVARHRHRPAGPDRRRPAATGVRAGRRLPGVRRRRRALRPARQLVDAGRALQRGEDRSGPPAREQTLERGSAGAAARARRRDGPGRGARPRRGRGRVDPFAPAGRQGRGGALDRRVRVPPRRARPLRLRLRRPVRLVPGDGQAAPLRGRQPRRRGARAACPCRDARARAPDHPVRDRGDLVVHARGRLAADGARVPGARRRAPRRGCGGGGHARDRRDAGAARLARRRRRCRRQVRARPPRGRGLRPHRHSRRAARAGRVVSRRRRAGRDGRRPGWQRRRARVRGARPGGCGAPCRRPARHAAAGDRARRGQARERGLHRQGTRRRGEGRAREARPPETGAGGPYTNAPGASRTPRPTCSRSSCSGCASGSSECGGY